MSKYNWERIKSEYVEGIRDEEGDVKYPTLKELSEKHGCTYLYIQIVSAKGNWSQERKIYIRKISELRQEKKSEVLASESAQFDSKTLEAARAGVGFIKEHLVGADKDLKDAQKLIDEERLEKLGRALVNYQKVGKLALGEVTVREEHKLEPLQIVVSKEDYEFAKGKNE